MHISCHVAKFWNDLLVFPSNSANIEYVFSLWLDVLILVYGFNYIFILILDLPAYYLDHDFGFGINQLYGILQELKQNNCRLLKQIWF